jgi:arsenate reductase
MPLCILFYCIGNSCRSPLAEAICRHLGGDSVKASSAGVAPLGSVSPEVLSLLQKLGINADGLASKPLHSVDLGDVDVVVSLDADFPVRRVLGPELRFRWEEWDIPDPFDEDEETYSRVAELLRQRIAALLEREGVKLQESG